MAAPGKKVGPIYVEVDGQTVKFELRLEVAAGRFHVEHEGQVYTADTKAALSDKLEAVVRHSRKITWTKYIVLDFESVSTTRRHTYGTTTMGLEDRAPNAVKGISLDWDVREFSNLHIPIGGDDEVILERTPGSDGVDHTHRARGRGRHRERPTMPDWAIPYSDERLAVLEQLRAALTAVDRKLRAFFGRDTEEVAAALDRGFEATGLPPLALPPPEPHAKGCARLQERDCDCGADDEEDGMEHEHEDWCRKLTRDACDCGKGDDE